MSRIDTTLTIHMDVLVQILDDVLNARDVFDFDLRRELLDRILSASHQISSISLHEEPEPPKNGPYR